MKRHIIAIVLGSFVALPAVANDEIDAGNLPKDVTPTKTRAQVHSELVAAQQAGQVIANGELGSMASEPVQVAGKSREQVRAELVASQRAGETVVNAESGLTERQMHPSRYADAERGQMRADIGSAQN